MIESNYEPLWFTAEANQSMLPEEIFLERCRSVSEKRWAEAYSEFQKDAAPRRRRSCIAILFAPARAAVLKLTESPLEES